MVVLSLVAHPPGFRGSPYSRLQGRLARLGSALVSSVVRRTGRSAFRLLRLSRAASALGSGARCAQRTAPPTPLSSESFVSFFVASHSGFRTFGRARAFLSAVPCARQAAPLPHSHAKTSSASLGVLSLKKVEVTRWGKAQEKAPLVGVPIW